MCVCVCVCLNKHIIILPKRTTKFKTYVDHTYIKIPTKVPHKKSFMDLLI